MVSCSLWWYLLVLLIRFDETSWEKVANDEMWHAKWVICSIKCRTSTYLNMCYLMTNSKCRALMNTHNSIFIIVCSLVRTDNATTVIYLICITMHYYMSYDSGDQITFAVLICCCVIGICFILCFFFFHVLLLYVDRHCKLEAMISKLKDWYYRLLLSCMFYQALKPVSHCQIITES